MIKRFNDTPDLEKKIDLALDMAEMNYPPVLLNYCIDTLLSSTELHALIDGQSLVCFTHNLNLEGAPLALFNYIKTCPEFSIITIISPSSGPLDKDCSYLDYCVNVEPFLFESNPNASIFESLLLRIKIHLISLKAKKHIINTTRGWLIALACHELGIEYIWWIHEAEEPFFFITSSDIRCKALNLLKISLCVRFASLATMKRYTQYVGGRDSLSNILYPRSVKKEFQDLMHFSAKYRDNLRSDFREALGIQKRTKVILTVGALCSRKNQFELIKSLVHISQKIELNFLLLLVGDQVADSVYFTAIRQYLDTKISPSVKKKFIFIEPTDDIHMYYLASDLYVHSSNFECYSQAVNEAKYLGKKIFVRDCEGMDEVLAAYSNASTYKKQEDLNSLLALCLDE